MAKNVLLIGNLTIDENIYGSGESFSGPGGSVFFLAKTFENLEVSATIFSAYGEDFPKKYLSETNFIPATAAFKKTLRFKNIYFDGKREQKVENYTDYLQFSLAAAALAKIGVQDLVFVAPILNNIKLNDLKLMRKLFPTSFLCLLPQGLFRKIDSWGNIQKIDLEIPGDSISDFDFISFSEIDMINADKQAYAWSREGPMVALTRAERGASLYKNGKRVDSPAYKVAQIKDPTGAGDIFAAGFVFNFLQTHEIISSLEFGQAVAALSLRSTSDKLQYNLKEIIDYERFNR